MIKQRIEDGTMVYSNWEKYYNCYKQEAHQHLIVTYAVKFEDPDTGTHTKHIERV